MVISLLSAALRQIFCGFIERRFFVFRRADLSFTRERFVQFEKVEKAFENINEKSRKGELNTMAEEKGHAKNIANFAEIISVLTALGATYNPGSALIKLPALNAVHADSVAAQTEADTDNALEIAAVNARANAFEPLSKFVTRIRSAARALIADPLFLADLDTIIRKLQGRRAGEKPVDDPSTPDIDESEQTSSPSQMSFDNRIQHFAELIALLKTNPAYTPNETELKIPALESMLADLRAKDTAAANAEITARNTRTARNTAFYDAEGGILARVALVKNYLKSILAYDSPQYQQIVALKFKKP